MYEALLLIRVCLIVCLYFLFFLLAMMHLTPLCTFCHNFFFIRKKCVGVGRSYMYSASQKRKPVLSVIHLHYHARFNQTICFIIIGIFSSFILIPNIMMISQCMNEKEQFKLMHVKIDLRRIMVFRLSNPCQNKKSKGAFMLNF